MRYLKSLICLVAMLYACPVNGQTFTADQFMLDSIVGSTLRMDMSETEIETRFWLGEDPQVTTSNGTAYLRFVPANEVIDGIATNVIMLWGDEQAGPPNFEGNPAIASAADGFINFGNHPSYTGNREHFINGRTMIPATMTVGDSFVDTRCTTWEGQWEEGEQWTGINNSTITIVGIESITLSTGVYNALRIDTVEDRTKNGVAGDHWATEHWETSIWLVEGVGLVKMSEHELKRHYYTFYDNGTSPISEYSTQADTIFTQLGTIILGDVNSDGLVNGFDVDPFVDVLLNGPYQIEADVNSDGLVNGFDVDPFVALVLGGGEVPDGAEIPEPTTLVLLGLGGLALRRHHRKA